VPPRSSAGEGTEGRLRQREAPETPGERRAEGLGR
jgi:hypothetical protein